MFFRDVTSPHIAQARASLCPRARTRVPHSWWSFWLLSLTAHLTTGKKWVRKLGYIKLKLVSMGPGCPQTSSQPALCACWHRVRRTARHRVTGRLWAKCPQERARLLPSLVSLLGTRKEESESRWLSEWVSERSVMTNWEHWSAVIQRQNLSRVYGRNRHVEAVLQILGHKG